MHIILPTVAHETLKIGAKSATAHCIVETYIFADTIVSYGSGWVEDDVVSTRTQKI
jgi:hypothetical protein